MRKIASALSLALAACAGEPRAEAKAEGERVTSLSEISGPWDIVRFGGHAPARLDSSGLRHAYVDVGRDSLSYTIECNYSGNRARMDEAGILHDEDGGSRTMTLMSCGPEADARDGAFYGFFARKPLVRWGAGGRLVMASGAIRLVLERPEARRLAHVPPLRELEGRWVPQMASRLVGSSGHEGWGFQQPETLAIEGGRLSYSGCGGVSLSFRYGADGRLATSGGEVPAACGTENPGTMLLKVLRASPLVERTADGGIALTSGREIVSLKRQ
jgi:hypothetical protein